MTLSMDDLKPSRPANAWQHPRRRDRFRHLLDPASVKDVSFLYDATARQTGLQPLEGEYYCNGCGHLHVAITSKPSGPVLEEDRNTIRARNEQHPVPLPTLGPSGRAEAQMVLRTMDQRLRAAGVEDDVSEGAAPTPLHALLELVRKEQSIYSTTRPLPS